MKFSSLGCRVCASRAKRLLIPVAFAALGLSALSANGDPLVTVVENGVVLVTCIRRLREERPDAVGLAVPGMPYGSPGMGPESQREAYDVLLIGRDGSTEVFTRYLAA